MTEATRPIRLALFMTRGVPLAMWDSIGSFTRETALYRRLAERGVRVTIVSWGDASDLAYRDRLPGFTICCNRWGLPVRWYERLLPWLHRRELRAADLIKTNQTDGADVALAAARRWGKPLIARCGYMWSKNRLLEDGPDSPRAQRALRIEQEVFGAADRIVVTTESMREEIARRFPARAGRACVIPNYVDADLFSPAASPDAVKGGHALFVGRLSAEKNLPALIEALRGLGVGLHLAGQGPMREELERAGVAAGVPLEFLGPVPNEQLPDLIRGARLFALTSLYEGHPKTLIEAMACGATVLGTDVSGIREVIRHGETGWLTAADAAALREGLQRLLADDALCRRLGEGARQFALEHYSLSRIVEREAGLYAAMLKENA